MKILIVGFAKIKYMPYLRLHLDNLDAQKNDIHILYWNRDLKEEDLSVVKNCTIHEFRCYQEDNVKRILKIKSFIKFRFYASKVLKEKYDFIIVLQSLPGVIIADKLMRKYKGKYIFDYRDKTYETMIVYHKIICSLINKSYKTFISSDGYRKHLPLSNKLVTTHNIWAEGIKKSDKSFAKTKSSKITLGFWGFIRDEKTNLEIIKKVSEDGRFELKYFGREQAIAKALRKYVEENNIKNVTFYGEYSPDEKDGIAHSVDIIHNIYGDVNMSIAMSNKYYDGLIYKMPQLCMEGTFMAESAEKNGVGKAVNPYNDDFLQQVYDYYRTIDEKAFVLNCEKQLDEVFAQYKVNQDIIRAISDS